MQISNYKRSRRAMLTFLVGGAALIGGATGVIPLSAEPRPAGGDVTPSTRTRNATAARDMPTTSVITDLR